MTPRTASRAIIAGACMLACVGTAGMASACQLQTKPVLHAFRDLMDRKKVQGTKRKQLVKVVEDANAHGVATQHKPGAMSCKDVQAQVKKTIYRLEHAK